MADNIFTELEQKIQKASQDYYTNGQSEYTDEEFDMMIEQLKKENPNSELLNQVGWGYSVNEDTTPGEKLNHKYGKAGSLDKFRTFDEFKPDFKKYQNFDISLKLDGLSVVLYYHYGKLYQALTRGDGFVGVDITNKVELIAPYLKNCLKDKAFSGAIRGEILMSYKNFEQFKQLYPDAKNPRNSAVGLITTKEITTDLRFLNIVVYSIVGVESSDYLPYYTIDFKEWGMPIARTWLSENFDNSNIVKYTEVCEYYPDGLLDPNRLRDITSNLKERWYGEYPADGLVFSKRELIFDKKNNSIIQNAMAFKFKAETADTRVKNIEWNLTKTGYLMPRIEVDTVQLSGTNVSFCTGYNAKYIQDNNIGINSIVEIEKHGEIIPNINEVKKSTGCELPTHCPHCNSELIWNGVHLQCINPECSGNEIQDLLVWLQSLSPVDGLGDKIKLKYLNQIIPTPNGLTIKEVMEFPTHNNEYFIIPGRRGGHLSLVHKMLLNLWGASDDDNIPLVNAIKALNIPRFGDVTSEKLAEYPKEFFKLYTLYANRHEYNTMSYMLALSDERVKFTALIGEANAKSLIDNINKLDNLKYIAHRINWDAFPETANLSVEFAGKVAITGKLSCKRTDFEKELKAKGFKPGEISKDTKFLITDNPNSSSSKNKKADEWGIEKITEAEFRNRYLK